MARRLDSRNRAFRPRIAPYLKVFGLPATLIRRRRDRTSCHLTCVLPLPLPQLRLCGRQDIAHEVRSLAADPALHMSVADHQTALEAYLDDGERRARALGNRGPLRFDEQGQVHQNILEAYWRESFYVLENVMGAEELDELRQEVDRVLAGAPVEPGATLGASGRPVIGRHFTHPTFLYAVPLSDPVGGKATNEGRHPVNMTEPKPAADAPAYTIERLHGNLQMALWRRKMPRGVIMHTDRGSQYCSKQYQRMLRKHGLICSMSGTGNCFDNACAETFFHSLKIEAIYGNRYPSRESVRQEVFEYIETFYNTTRLHSSLGYVSPSQFEMAAVA